MNGRRCKYCGVHLVDAGPKAPSPWRHATGWLKCDSSMDAPWGEPAEEEAPE